MATAILFPDTTPSDYHRIISPQLVLPTDPNVSIPVGLIACQRKSTSVSTSIASDQTLSASGDPLLKSLETIVVSCVVSKPSPTPSTTKKPAKKAVSAPQLPDDPILEVQLHDTIIFPEGGGQPTDTGSITTKADGLSFQVVQAKRHGGHAVHYVRVAGVSVEDAVQALSPGAQVTVALGHEGWERRYDHVGILTLFLSFHWLMYLRYFCEDGHAHIAAHAIGALGVSAELTDAFMVFDFVSSTLLH